jgi:hypothetical protein
MTENRRQVRNSDARFFSNFAGMESEHCSFTDLHGGVCLCKPHSGLRLRR